VIQSVFIKTGSKRVIDAFSQQISLNMNCSNNYRDSPQPPQVELPPQVGSSLLWRRIQNLLRAKINKPLKFSIFLHLNYDLNDKIKKTAAIIIGIIIERIIINILFLFPSSICKFLGPVCNSINGKSSEILSMI